MGPNHYIQHWRHVQYCTNLEMAALFFTSAEYSAYLEGRGGEFKEDIFYSCRCKCITQSDFEECSCPHCTIWREAVRSYHRQRASWHREAEAAGKKCIGCKCGDPEFLQASKSSGSLRTYLHSTCGKRSIPGLKITEGPKSAEVCEFYRRQCCRVPLPELKEAQLLLQLSLDASAATAADPLDARLRGAATKAQAAAQRAAVELGYSAAEMLDSLDCRECGWELCMPRCPLEWDASKGATIKKYEQVLQTDGITVQSELREVRTTRQGLMEHRHSAGVDLNRRVLPPPH